MVKITNTWLTNEEVNALRTLYYSTASIISLANVLRSMVTGIDEKTAKDYLTAIINCPEIYQFRDYEINYYDGVPVLEVIE